jgi:hypothetical protein
MSHHVPIFRILLQREAHDIVFETKNHGWTGQTLILNFIII